MADVRRRHLANLVIFEWSFVRLYHDIPASAAELPPDIVMVPDDSAGVGFRRSPWT